MDLIKYNKDLILVYDCNMQNDYFDTSQTVSVKAKNKSNRLIMPLMDQFEAAERLNGKKQQNIEPSYLSQFEEQTYDVIGEPSAKNNTYNSLSKNKINDMKNQISYDEGWSQYDQLGAMNYGVTDDMSHNNMVPFYKQKGNYGSNKFLRTTEMNLKRELFTGNLKDTWKPKTAHKPLFKPMQDGNPYGTPIYSEKEKERVIPGRYYQGAKPFESKMVSPGVNIGANEVGTHGYHSMYRAMPKNIDELKVNPKTVLEGQMIESGMRGQARPMQAPVISYRPQTYKTNTDNDILPTGGVMDAARPRDNVHLKKTDRSVQHREEVGVPSTAHGQNHVPTSLQGVHKPSDKQVYKLPAPVQKHTRDQTQFNPNFNSYDVQPTMRSITGVNSHTGNIGAVNGTSTYVNSQNAPRQTNKETTVNIPYNTNLTSVGQAQGQASSFNWIPTKATQKEDLVGINQNNFVTAVGQSQGQSSAFNWVPTDTTLKETLVEIPQNNNVTLVNQAQGQASTFNWMPTKTTQKESLVEISQNTQLTPINQIQGQASTFNWVPTKTTQKESLVEISQNTILTPINQTQGQAEAFDWKPLKTTQKEELVTKLQNTQLTPVGQLQGKNSSYNMNPLKTTTKESLVTKTQNTYMTPVGQTQGQSSTFDWNPLKTTQKEELITKIQNNQITPVGQTQGQANSFNWNPLKTTTKEELIEIPRSNQISLNQNQGIASTYNRAPLQTTLKEELVSIPRQTQITNVDQSRGKMDTFDRTPLKTTNKEQLTQIPVNTQLTAVGQNMGTASTFNWVPTKTTQKESLVELSQNTNLTAVGQSQGKSSTFDWNPFKTTNKEELVQHPTQMHLTAVGQTQGKATSFDWNPLKTTNKEELVQNPTQMHVTAVASQQGQAASYSRDPLKTTTKEGTIDNKYIGSTTMTTHGGGHGYLAETHYAPTTQRETTVTETYITPLEGEHKQMPYDAAYNIEISDKKQALVTNDRSPTACNVNMGPDPNRVHMRQRKVKDNDRQPTVGYTPSVSLDRIKTINSVRETNQIPSDRSYDDALQTQLSSNPYNISILSGL